MPTQIPIPVNNARKAESMCQTSGSVLQQWGGSTGFLSLFLLLIPHSPAEFQCPGNTVGDSQGRGSLEGAQEEMRPPLAHWRGDGPAGRRACGIFDSI